MAETKKKKIGVTLDPDLHNKVKSAAPLRGLNVEKAYDQALRGWLGEGSDATTDGPPLTSEQSLLLEEITQLLGSKPTSLTFLRTQVASYREITRETAANLDKAAKKQTEKTASVYVKRGVR